MWPCAAEWKPFYAFGLVNCNCQNRPILRSKMLVDGLSIDLTRQGLSRSTILFLLSKNALTDARDGARMPSPDLFACDGVMARSIVKQRDRYVRTYVPGTRYRCHTYTYMPQHSSKQQKQSLRQQWLYIYMSYGARSQSTRELYIGDHGYIYTRLSGQITITQRKRRKNCMRFSTTTAKKKCSILCLLRPVTDCCLVVFGGPLRSFTRGVSSDLSPCLVD